jgi:hypothetical protein
VYVTDRGTALVQGYKVLPSEAGMQIPDGEMLVEIPRRLILSAAEQLSAEG